ncbi:MAG TPA: MBL fold metallo-hydrolase [Gemmatimonadales bacterium]|nr:MBL fold metallo-hydrolase [Gemmatimonadales bacterium]
MRASAVVRLALSFLLLALPLWGQQLELRFLDVGQGDALLVREGGKTAMIDAGPSGDVALRLRALGIDTIDLAVASHNHADHIGGMAAILSQFVVRFYLDNGLPHATATAEGGGDRADQNNSSVGIVVEFGDFRALLTGDSELPELAYWLRYDTVPRVQVVKVAHHGTWNGTSREWVERTHPVAAVISVGAGNSYGHPSARGGAVASRRRSGVPHGPGWRRLDARQSRWEFRGQHGNGARDRRHHGAALSGRLSVDRRIGTSRRARLLQGLHAREGMRELVHQQELPVSSAAGLRV